MLLAAALDGLAAQTRPADLVVVVDNASGDGSAEVARAHALAPEVLELARNTGGAGGFAAGLARALARGADLVWLMDDDTVPTPGALERLLAARAAHQGRAVLWASRAVWTDGRDHPMNTPRERPLVDAATRARAAAAGALPVRSASFVALLVDGAAVRARGLPVADYFIWNDDFEFTTRLLRDAEGLFVPGSVVEHRTRTFGSTDADPGERFAYEVRNKLWLFGRSSALRPLERVLYAGSTLRRWVRTVRRSSDRPTLLRAGARGLRDGLRHGPRPTAEVLAGLGLDEDLRALARPGGRA